MENNAIDRLRKLKQDSRLFAETAEEIRLLQILKSIDGFLSEEEALALYRTSRQLPDDCPLVVELGTWKGRSTVALASGLIDKQSPKLVCVDPFDGSALSVHRSETFAENANLLECFLANVANAGVLDLIEVKQGHSYEYHGEFDQSIDLLFIDADHEYTQVKRDYLQWSSKIKKGGLLLMDDVYLEESPKHPGPVKLVLEHLLENDSWQILSVVGAVFQAKKLV